MKRDLPLLTFVVPCYNEAPRVSSTLDHIRQACELAELTRSEILVVDDCSTDTTSEVVENYIAQTENGSTIQLSKSEVNKGLGRTFAVCSLGRLPVWSISYQATGSVIPTAVRYCSGTM